MADEDHLEEPRHYRIFLSHSGEDKFVVENAIRPKVVGSGAAVFVDVAEIKFGDDFHDRIFKELNRCDELIILCTRSALSRPWIFAEIGAALLRKRRIVLIVYGPTDAELQALGVLSLIGTNKLLRLDDFDQYVAELSDRVREHLHV